MQTRAAQKLLHNKIISEECGILLNSMLSPQGRKPGPESQGPFKGVAQTG